MDKKQECEKCGSDGVLLLYNSDEGRTEIQRCDDCQKFESDIDAWKIVKPKESQNEE